MKNFLNKILKCNFPYENNILQGIGYGSAVFNQANYNISQANQVIDILIVVKCSK